MVEFNIKGGRVADTSKDIASKVYAVCENLRQDQHAEIKCSKSEATAVRSAVRAFRMKNDVPIFCSLSTAKRGDTCSGYIQYR